MPVKPFIDAVVEVERTIMALTVNEECGGPFTPLRTPLESRYSQELWIGADQAATFLG